MATRRDLGNNNVAKRLHLVISKAKIYDICESDKVTEKLQKVVDKIEHKLTKCENFLNDNKDEISLSYYTEGYYNGRAGAYEDVIDIIDEYLNGQV